MDWDKCVFKLNTKAMCEWEKMSGKSFFSMSTGDEDEAILLIYCIMDSNNDIDFTYDVFKGMITNKKFEMWLGKKINYVTKYTNQFNNRVSESNSGDEPDEENTMCHIASTLIVRYGIDPHYVMYEMSQWEIEPYVNAYNNMQQEDYERDRFWTYVQVSPHVDSRKLKGPQSLVKFPWEKSDKKRKEEELNNKTASIMRTFAMMNKEG